MSCRNNTVRFKYTYAFTGVTTHVLKCIHITLTRKMRMRKLTKNKKTKIKEYPVRFKVDT